MSEVNVHGIEALRLAKEAAGDAGYSGDAGWITKTAAEFEAFLAPAPAPAPAIDVVNRFDYHPPSTDDVKGNHEAVRAVLRQAANHLISVTPAGREQSLAITKIEEAMFWANAAIARNQPEGDTTDE